jgi:outer membrane protein, heavy metal efflux system
MLARLRPARGWPLIPLSWLFVFGLGIPPGARAEAPPPDVNMATPLDRATLVRLVVARNPSVRAAEQRAHATATMAEADGRLPAPELAGQVWQVPLSRPTSLRDSQMIMVGVSQSFPAPGSLAAREDARRQQGLADQAMAGERAREVARDAGHAFADYVEATAGHRSHSAHQQIARRLLVAAEGRQAGGGALADVTYAEVQLAQVQADLATDAARMDTARARINALLGRPPSAPLGLPIEEGPEIPAWGEDAILTAARNARPELRAASAQQDAKRSELHAAESEATWPTFSVGVSYFAPTALMPFDGYGVNAGMSLPWLWGAADRRREAQRQYLTAAISDIAGVQIRVEADVVTADSNVRGAALRLQVVRERVQPATRRALDVAWAGYASGRTDLLTLLAATRSVVDADHDAVMARALLDHALAELDAAVGVPVPRRPLGPLAPDSEEAGHG